jgi:pyochelin biosynthesis protein PchC
VIRSTTDWIRQIHKNAETNVRLVCFPHAGGTSGFYRRWSPQFPAVELLAVQYPGRQDRRGEPNVENLMDMVPPIADELASWNDRPFAMFGHSMGAAIAFEVARHLEQIGAPTPVWFFASSRSAPSLNREKNIPLRDCDGLMAQMRHFKGTDRRLLDDEEGWQMILPSIRSDFKAVKSYAYTDGPNLQCPLTALTGSSDRLVKLDDAAAWSQHTAGAFELRVFSGGHFYLVECQTKVTELINDRLRAFTAFTATSAPDTASPDGNRSALG